MVQYRPWFPIIALISLALIIAPQVTLANDNGQPVTVQSIQTVAKDSNGQSVILKSNERYYIRKSNATGDTVFQRQILPNELIVKYKDVSDLEQTHLNALTQAVNRLNAQVQPLNQSLGLALVKLSDGQNYFVAMETLRNHPAIEYAEPNYQVNTEAAPDDPYYAMQWSLASIAVERAWETVPLAKRSAVTIAILDTGITKDHEDLQENIVPGYDFVNNDNDPEDNLGHGTHVAGIAAGIANNGKGIAGVASGSKIMPVKVLDDEGNGSYATIINGIQYAADHGADVINLSLGSTGTSSAMQDAVNYAISRGANVVAAAGNSGGPVMFPANCDGVIAVGAIDNTGNRADYSNYGPELDVVAPGSNITSTFMSSSSSYASMTGTSMASPAVAGVVALVRAANPSLSPPAVIDIIHQSAQDLGSPGFDDDYGYGLVNASKAVQIAAGSTGGTDSSVNTNDSAVISSILTSRPTTNLALHKKVTSSSAKSSDYQASSAVDGNPATCWITVEKTDPQWLTVDLGKLSMLSKFVLRWNEAYAKSWQILVSKDGINWTKIYSTTSGTGEVTTLTGTTKARYVKLVLTSRGTSYGYSLREFEIYGQ